jgi:nucleotide-binding universal stress UspA family protein
MINKTNPIKKILISLDYDKSSKKIAEQGFALALAMNAEIVLLHVISEETVYYSDYSYRHELEIDFTENIEELTKKFLDQTKTRLENNSIQTLVLKGDIAKTILETAKKMHVDIIVIGSHSRKWMAKIIMGSRAEEVIKKTSIPLFVVPTAYQLETLE